MKSQRVRPVFLDKKWSPKSPQNLSNFGEGTKGLLQLRCNTNTLYFCELEKSSCWSLFFDWRLNNTTKATKIKTAIVSIQKKSWWGCKIQRFVEDKCMLVVGKDGQLYFALCHHSICFCHQKQNSKLSGQNGNCQLFGFDNVDIATLSYGHFISQ